MNNQNRHLLTLIKLLEGHLSVAEGVKVREQFASDSLLLKRWKEISSLYENKKTRNDFENINNILLDTQLVAAFVEEELSSDEQDQFESACWNETASLQEVISTYQALHTTKTSEKIPKEFASASERMLDVAMIECMQADVSKSSGNYFQQQIEEYHPPQLNGYSVNGLAPEISIASSNKKRVKHSSTPEQQPSLKSQRWVYVAAAIAITVMIVPAYFVFFAKDDNKQTIPIVKVPPSPPKTNPIEKQNVPNDKRIPKLVVVPDSEKEIDPSPEKPLPPLMKKEDENKTPVVVKKEGEHNLQLSWSVLSGIVGVRTDDELAWKGILTEAASQRDTIQEKRLQIRTLPSSWLQGTINNGTEFVIDANSEIEIAVRENVDEKSNLHIRIISGKVAFAKLQQGDRLHVQQGEYLWVIQAKQNGTSVGFMQQKKNKRRLMTFSGAVQITSSVLENEVTMQENQMVVLRGDSINTPSKISRQTTWQLEPPESLNLNRQSVAQMNRSKNLLAALLSTPAGKNNKEIVARTNLSFTLNSIQSVPQASNSQKEMQRKAAIEWLITAKDNNESQAIWNKIDELNNSGQAKFAVRTWFKAARKKVPASQKQLAELSVGLNATQPLFVRQCSIYFLRKITKQRLGEYKPNNPTAATINSVRQKVRRVMNNKRRSR